VHWSGFAFAMLVRAAGVESLNRGGFALDLHQQTLSEWSRVGFTRRVAARSYRVSGMARRLFWGWSAGEAPA